MQLIRRGLFCLALALPATAHAQSVQQSGVITPGHAACWAITGVIFDCGSPGGGVSVVGSTTQNDFAAFNGSGSLIDSGINPTATSNWSGPQNFNGGATTVTRPPGDNTTNIATTAFVATSGNSILAANNIWTGDNIWIGPQPTPSTSPAAAQFGLSGGCQATWLIAITLPCGPYMLVYGPNGGGAGSFANRSSDFIVGTTPTNDLITHSVYAYHDSTNFAAFTGTIAGTTLTFPSVTGTVYAGSYLYGTGVTPGTTIVSGSGLTWTVSASQTVGPVAMTSVPYFGVWGSYWLAVRTATAAAAPNVFGLELTVLNSGANVQANPYHDPDGLNLGLRIDSGLSIAAPQNIVTTAIEVSGNTSTFYTAYKVNVNALSPSNSGLYEAIQLASSPTGSANAGHAIVWYSGADVISGAIDINTAGVMQLNSNVLTTINNGAQIGSTGRLNIAVDGTFGTGQQLTLQGSTNTNKALELGYDTASEFGYVQAIFAGTAFEPFFINPAGGAFGVGAIMSPVGDYAITNANAWSFNTNVFTSGAATHTGQILSQAARTVVSASGAVLDDIDVVAETTTLSGSTNVTTATGFNKVSLYQPTYAASSAITISNAATLFIQGPPAAGTDITITNPWSLWIPAGKALFGGQVNMTGLATSGTGGAVSAVCWSATAGSLWTDTSGTICGISATMFKTPPADWLPLNPDDALEGVKSLRLAAWQYLPEYHRGSEFHVGPIADDVIAMNPLCGVDGGHNYSDRCVETYLAGSVQALEAKLSRLQRDFQVYKDNHP